MYDYEGLNVWRGLEGKCITEHVSGLILNITKVIIYLVQVLNQMMTIEDMDLRPPWLADMVNQLIV